MSVDGHFDLLVIGSGPGGEGAAMKAAKSGKRVGVIERYFQIGGGSTHWGTIPSKSLREAIKNYTDFRNNPLFKDALKHVSLDYPSLLKTAEQVISKQVSMREAFYERNSVDIIGGQAEFIDPHHLAVHMPDGVTKRFSADYIIIATGSRPFHPEDIDFNNPRVLDSDTILRLDRTPHSMTVYGAGVIGCEYASIFRNLGMKLTLINTRDKLLSFLDDEIIDALAYHFRDQGILIKHNEEFEGIEYHDDGIVINLASGKKVKSDYLLWANGRMGNTEDLRLEHAGVTVNHRKQIEINEHYQTNAPHIYAVGDVVGYPGLASAAFDQGRYAAIHLIEGVCNYRLVQQIPTGIYTSPEISSIGLTERELTTRKIPYETGHSQFRSLARAQIVGNRVGMLKLLFHRETLEILGVHCFGYQASEIIHIGQAIMTQQGSANTMLYFANTTFNYPTMAEAYRVAALNGLNRVF